MQLVLPGPIVVLALYVVDCGDATGDRRREKNIDYPYQVGNAGQVAFQFLLEGRTTKKRHVNPAPQHGLLAACFSFCCAQCFDELKHLFKSNYQSNHQDGRTHAYKGTSNRTSRGGDQCSYQEEGKVGDAKHEREFDKNSWDFTDLPTKRVTCNG